MCESLSGWLWLPLREYSSPASLGEVLTGSGFLNGIIAYGVAFIHSPHLESWRILFLIEGLLTVMIAVVGLLLLPENIDTCRFLSAEEKDYLKYERYMSMGHETNEINWKHAREAPLRWQQYLRE